ncbi:MAG: heat shock protein HspQ [Acidobacteriota bacterium]|nr:heat shock protein HspQ [Acidobacteriota bacterium]
MDPAESLHIRNLVMLLGAESPIVRRKVRHELSRSSDRLQLFLDTYQPELPPELLFELEEIRQRRQQSLRHENWLDWLRQPTFHLQLENALSYLAGVQSESPPYPPLSVMLDGIVQDFLAESGEHTPTGLNKYLFVENRYRGAEKSYYHPLNSNLPHVIATHKGLPISLALIFMLCGIRLGLNIQGFNLPGHFLARADEDGETLLFDCFNKGKRLSRQEMTAAALSPKIDFQGLLDRPPTAAQIITRVLLNMINAYYQDGSLNSYRQVQGLLSQLREHEAPAEDTEKPPLFQPGQLVRHRRYGYRGVVVELDPSCKADEAWYRSNLTQPRRDQPWYHVLVDCSTATTYAAQTSLEPDPDSAEIRHPLITLYFDRFQEGRYQRNETPWNMPG